MAKLTDRTALGGAPATGDLLFVTDVSDTTDAATGTDKKMTVANLLTSPTLTTPNIGAATGTSLQLSGLTASEIVITDASKNLASAAVATYPSLTELSYVKGVTSAVQTQINAKGVGTWTDSSTSTGTNKTFNDHTNAIEADALHIQVRNSSGATLAKGDAVYVSGYNMGLDLVEVALADADDPTKMPAVGLVEANISNNATGSVDTTGRISDVVTNGYSVGDFLYVSTTGTTGNTLTSTKPTGATAQIQKIGEVLRSHATLGVIQVIGSGRSNDFPNYHTDDRFRIADNSDTTKLVDFQVSGVTTGTTRTLTVPDASGTLLLSGGALGTPSSGTLTNCSGLPLSGVVDSTSEALGVGSLELGHASDTTITRTGAGAIAVEGVGVALNSTSLPHTTSQLELGNASDTTLTRVSAGVVAVEGNNVILANTAATRSLVLTASGGNPTTTAGCASPTKVEAGTNDVDYFVLDFDATSNEYAFWNVVMPDNYDGSTITATFYWTSAAGSAGNVIWGLQGRSYANDAAIDQAWGTAQEVTDAWIANGDVHITSATAAITLGGTPAGGEYVALRAYRNAASGSDTLSGDARLLSVKVEYGINAYSE